MYPVQLRFWSARPNYTIMRSDMYKIVVERPRRSKDLKARALRFRNSLDGPSHLGMRVGYGYRELNENLAPLRRYLHSQVGRPWDRVFGEICSRIDRRNPVQRHIHQHIDQFIATRVQIRAGKLIECGKFGLRLLGGSNELYVNPRTGLICRTKTPACGCASERQRREQAETGARRRILDEHTQLLKLEDAWFEVNLEPLPETKVPVTCNGKIRQPATPEIRFDVVTREPASQADRRGTSALAHDHWRKRLRLYGSGGLYATHKRQLSKREIKTYGLR
jgi:hypothetical protein